MAQGAVTPTKEPWDGKRSGRGSERDGHENGETGRKRGNAAKRRVEPDKVGRASDGRRDGRLDSITWRTILPRRHCLLEHLLGFSWFGTPSTVSRVPLHHDILFARYNTDDDDENDGDDVDEDEGEDEDRNGRNKGGTLPIRSVDLGILGNESAENALRAFAALYR